MLKVKAARDWQSEYCVYLRANAHRQMVGSWVSRDGGICAIAALYEMYHGKTWQYYNGLGDTALSEATLKTGVDHDLRCHIIHMNDNCCMTFPEIAAYLEQYWGLDEHQRFETFNARYDALVAPLSPQAMQKTYHFYTDAT